MTSIARQNTLFISEDWVRIYEALENVDFRAYDFDNLVKALLNYLRLNYNDEYNDWIASSEFVTKLEILAWLSQNIAFRVDLNTRENFLATAERRDSLIRLAQNIAYKINRVRGASGLVKIVSVRTTQSIRDSNGVTLQEKTIRWNDPRDEDWYERFILLMNAALATRTKFGRPLTSYVNGSIRTDQYVFRSIAPSSGTFPTTASVNGVTLPFDVYNANLDQETGSLDELAPSTSNAFNVFYKLDGRGFSSTNTGFFLPLKQGTLAFQDVNFSTPIILQTVDLNASNINNDDFFVQKIDTNGNVLENWTQVDTIFGEGVSFNTSNTDQNLVYELNTLVNDRVRVRFGDGAFGKIPVGRFRFWYRTSNAQPLVVKPTAIQNQTLTIPYVVDNTVHYLTMTYSLQDQLTNAGLSETNFDIRTRANKVYYTQNRMITGQDYNSFFLKDNTIRKVKTVNRTYSGHSRYSKLNDPTGFYQNIKHIAEDGRFYQDNTRTITLVSADTDILPNVELINRYIKPLIRQEDKRLLYYNRYLEITFSSPYTWMETSIIDGQSRGNITRNGAVQVVGTDAVNNLKYVNADALLRYSGTKGPLVTVDRVVEDGTAEDGVILRTDIPDAVSLISVFPPLRNLFTNQEQIDLDSILEQHLDFGISWNQLTQKWQFITFDNLDKTSEFSLAFQGDNTAAGLDASWMILIEYLPDGNEDQWRITDRGIGLFFESAREIDFIVTNTDFVVDPETGRVARDQVRLLESNESRDSLRRRRLQPFGDDRCNLNAYTFIGDGVTTCFKTSETLAEDTTVVLVADTYRAYGIDFLITKSATGDSVCFFVAPAAGEVIEIRISNRFINADVNVAVYVGDGATEEYDLDQPIVVPNNIVTFIDGIMQNSSLDFGVGQVGENASIVFNDVLGSGTRVFVYYLSGVDSYVFSKYNFLGDGGLMEFSFPLGNQTVDTILIAQDGTIQSPSDYTVTSTTTSTTVMFVTPPGEGVRIRMIAVTDPSLAKTKMYEFTTGGQNSFELAGLYKVAPENVIVSLDGVVQEGPWGSSPNWQITGDRFVLFNTPPVVDLKLVVYVIGGATGFVNSHPAEAGAPDNVGDIDVSSCFVSFLGVEVPLNVVDVLRHPDGYTNKNGVFVAPADEDLSGFYDNPLVFRDLVLLDGFTDLVLWRKVEEFGFDVWDPINLMTSPRGTYGLSARGDTALGDSYDATEVADGDIHYDVSTASWMIADGITETWIVAPDQTRYQYKIGRDHLKFLWTHYSPESNRIDPSVSIIHNTYLLESAFDDLYRTWLTVNGAVDDEPTPSDSETLRLQYASFNEFKAVGDAIIYYPARYKPLFGDQAISELRATFKIIQSSGSTISESDLRLRVLRAINDFFAVDLWDFGESFYFSELCSYIHKQLAPDLRTVVIVPRDNDEAFGRLFQVRAEPDELFINAAQPEHIEVVTALTDEELRIGVFV